MNCSIVTFWNGSLLQPLVTSQLGTINNLIHVKKSDFEVFDALQVDSLECSDTSGESMFKHMDGLSTLLSTITSNYDSTNIAADFNKHADSINYVTKRFLELIAIFDFLLLYPLLM